MARAVLLFLTFVGIGFTATACDATDSDIGKPCERKSQCAGDLVCDAHDGRGTCQQQHRHDPSRSAGLDEASLDLVQASLDGGDTGSE